MKVIVNIKYKCGVEKGAINNDKYLCENFMEYMLRLFEWNGWNNMHGQV